MARYLLYTARTPPRDVKRKTLKRILPHKHRKRTEPFGKLEQVPEWLCPPVCYRLRFDIPPRADILRSPIGIEYAVDGHAHILRVDH